MTDPAGEAKAGERSGGREPALSELPGWRALCLTVLAVDVLLLILHMVAVAFANDIPNFVYGLFNLGMESNLPTWWASVLWLGVSAAAFFCLSAELASPCRGRLAPLWALVGLVFLVASIDEVATIHEEVGSFLARERTWSPVLQLFPGGSPGSPWIVFCLPLVALALLVIAAFLWRRFARRPALRLCTLIAAVCYGLAVACDYYQGLDTISKDAVAALAGMSGPALSRATVPVEESLENLGSSLLLLALFAHGQLVRASTRAGKR